METKDLFNSDQEFHAELERIKSKICVTDYLEIKKLTWEEFKEYKWAPYWARYYCEFVVKKKVKELEPIIFTCPKQSANYCEFVAMERISEAEKIIFTCPQASLDYCEYVARERILEAEKIIFTESWSALHYCKEVAKEKIKEAESIIFSDSLTKQAYLAHDWEDDNGN